MGWQDREYARRPGGLGAAMRSAMYWLSWAMQASFPIGTYLRIRVRVHVLFVVLVLSELLLHRQGMPASWVLRWNALLFVSVLLHEFGHCLACRRVGGYAREILMWPLGGLARCHTPFSPGAAMVTTLGGPLVNLVIAGGCYGALWAAAPVMPVSLDPMHPWDFESGARLLAGSGLWGLVADLFVVNYILLLFNLLMVFFPFDGGRLVMEVMWWRMGYTRSIVIATGVGMVGAVAVALYAMTVGSAMLFFIAVFGFLTSYRTGAMRREPEGWVASGDEDYPGAEAPARESEAARRRREWEEARAAREREERLNHERRVDEVLDKISREGLQSLTSKEKRLLQKATQEKRGR